MIVAKTKPAADDIFPSPFFCFLNTHKQQQGQRDDFCTIWIKGEEEEGGGEEGIDCLLAQAFCNFLPYYYFESKKEREKERSAAKGTLRKLCMLLLLLLLSLYRGLPFFEFRTFGELASFFLLLLLLLLECSFRPTDQPSIEARLLMNTGASLRSFGFSSFHCVCYSEKRERERSGRKSRKDGSGVSWAGQPQ